MKKTLLPLIILAGLVSVLMLISNSRARGVTSPAMAQDSSSQRTIRSFAPGVKVEQARQVKLGGHPFVEVTLRNVSNVPITYLHIEHGGSFTEISFLTTAYLAPQATVVEQFDGQATSAIEVSAAVYADGTTEGKGLAVKKAAFYHNQFLAAIGRYLANIAAARAEHRSDAEVIEQVLSQAAQEPQHKEYRTTGALAASRFIMKTLSVENGVVQADRLTDLLRHFQDVQSTTHATRGDE